MFIARDLAHFKTLFVQRLKNMLADDEPGAFILVLANSLQDDYLRQALATTLNDNFEALHKRFNAGRLAAAPDDLDVFERLLAMDLSALPAWRTKTVGDWEITLNLTRQLRPARASKQVLSSIVQPFDETGFHFNKPFLTPEILWQGDYLDRPLRVLFNKFPFAPYHLLIAVEAEDARPQVLDEVRHRYIFTLAEQVVQTLPGFAVGYNSLAAGASVNHLHFQGFIREQAFCIERSDWAHNGGARQYPLSARRFTSAAGAWRYIETLTQQNIAFNCLYREGVCYVVPRKFLGTQLLPDWLDGAGWIDVAGVMTVSNQAVFDALDAATISQNLQRLAVE